MTIPDSQQLEAFVPVYDTVPESWEEGRQFLVEMLKKISNAVNIREIGWLLDEEYLCGQSFIPGVTAPGDNPGQFRSVLRKVVICGPLIIGLNTIPHGITVDANFTLIQLYGTATDNVAFTAEPLPNGGDTITLDSTNIYITVAAAWPLAYAFVSYTQEL